MTAPQEKLARSLDVLRSLQERGVAAIRAADLGRTHRERLVRHGFLLPVLKGWYVAADPRQGAGDSRRRRPHTSGRVSTVTVSTSRS